MDWTELLKSFATDPAVLAVFKFAGICALAWAGVEVGPALPGIGPWLEHADQKTMIRRKNLACLVVCVLLSIGFYLVGLVNVEAAQPEMVSSWPGWARNLLTLFGIGMLGFVAALVTIGGHRIVKGLAKAVA